MSRFLKRSVAFNLLFLAEGVGTFSVDVVVAAVLGVGAHSDALYAAWMVAQTIGRGMFQSLANAVLGLLGGPFGGARAYGQVLVCATLVGGGLSGVLVLAAAWWVPATMPGAAGAWVAGIRVARILSWVVVLFAMSEAVRAIAYREGHRWVPTSTRLAGAAAAILALLLLGAERVEGVAFALLIGATVEIALAPIVLFGALRTPFEWRLPDAAALGHLGHVAGKPMLGQSIRVMAGIVERALASFLLPGSLTVVSYASRIVGVVERVVFRGFVVSMIDLGSNVDRDQIRSRFRLVMLIATPMAAVVAVAPDPVVTSVFGRGAFTEEASRMLAVTLQAYGLAILTIAMSRIPLGFAYARRQGGIVFGYFLSFSISVIVLEVLMLQLGFGLRTFGIAYGVSMLVAFAWLFTADTRPHGLPLVTWTDVRQLTLVGVAALVGAALAERASLSWGVSNAWLLWLWTGAGAMIGGAVTGWLVGVRELRWPATLVGGER